MCGLVFLMAKGHEQPFGDIRKLFHVGQIFAKCWPMGDNVFVIQLLFLVSVFNPLYFACSAK